MSDVPHIVVTAGPTREMIDRVRDWGNIFSGRTGLDVARAFLAVGNVTLLTSNVEHAAAFDGYSGGKGMMGVETFRSHAELRELLRERMEGKVDVVAMTAAVADYVPAGSYAVIAREMHGDGTETWRVRNVDAPKVKSTHREIAILGKQTEKLVDLFRREWGYRGLLIKFKLEVGLGEEELIRVAGASRVASEAELMVANTLAMARPEEGSSAGEGGAFLIDEAGAERVGRVELAGRIVAWAAGRMAR